MPRQSPFLSWAFLQSCYRRAESAQATNQSSRQRIFSSVNKELPLWARVFSSRQFHTSAVNSKPKDDAAILQSVGIDWDSGSGSSDSYMQVILEWKSLQNRLKGKTTKVCLPDMGWSQPPPVPQDPTLPDFFVSNASQIPVAHEINRQEVVIPKMRERKGNTAIQNRLWITDLDSEVLKEASKSVMSQIRDGERDIDNLARIFLECIQAAAPVFSKEETQQEQARLFIFSIWITKAHHALSSKRFKVSAVAICVNVTADLYNSMRRKDSLSTNTKRYGLNGMRQANLHRLFGLLYSYTRHQGQKWEVAHLCCQAMTLIAILLRDNGLRPAQVRYLCRRFLVRLEHMTTMEVDGSGQDKLWSEADETFLHLTWKGVFSSPSLDIISSNHSSNLDTFLRLLCVALVKGYVKYAWAEAAILDLARTCQITNLQKRTLFEGDTRIESSSASLVELEKYQNDNFTIGSFVSQTTLETMIRILTQSGKFVLAKELAFMSPRWQRSLPILSHLMRRWSSVLPDFHGKDTRRRVHRTDPVHTCIISQQLWSEAMSLLDVNNRESLPAILDIFNSRMIFHARSRSPRLIAIDLKVLKGINGDTMSSSQLLDLLPGRAQVEIVRAYCRAANLTKAKDWAHKIIIACNARGNSGEMKNVDWLPVLTMNVLLSAYLNLKGNKKIFAARHRLSMLLCHGGAIKKQRIYLGRTVNKYFRMKKREFIPRYIPPRWLSYFRFRQACNYTLSFANRHGIIPDEKTTRILLAAILRIGPRRVSVEVLNRFKEQADFDWKGEGVSGVLDQIKILLEEGEVAPKTRLEGKLKEAAAERASMIDAAIEKHEWKQYFGQRVTK